MRSGEKDVRGSAADIIMINYNTLRALRECQTAATRRQVVRSNIVSRRHSPPRDDCVAEIALETQRCTIKVRFCSYDTLFTDCGR